MIMLKTSHIARLLSSNAAGKHALAEIARRLEAALETARSVEESAAQLMLEHDPSARQPRSHYVLHYSHMAEADLSQALNAVADCQKTMSADDSVMWQNAVRGYPGLALLIADTKLMKDKIHASIETIQYREQHNEI